jgi:cobalt-zinc-cadmium efflux system membrane fusion protein
MKLRPTALAMLMAALVLAGCKDAQKPAGKPAAEQGSTTLSEGTGDAVSVAPPDPLLVTVPPNFGAPIKVTSAGNTQVSDTLRVAGKVDFDQARVTRIGATVTGRVIEIQAHLGQQVRVGDSLAVINSTELGRPNSAISRPAPRLTCKRAASSAPASCLPPT